MDSIKAVKMAARLVVSMAVLRASMKADETAQWMAVS